MRLVPVESKRDILLNLTLKLVRLRTELNSIDVAYFRLLNLKWRPALALPKNVFAKSLQLAGIYLTNKEEILCTIPYQDKYRNLDSIGENFFIPRNSRTRRSLCSQKTRRNKLNIACSRKHYGKIIEDR